MVYTWRMIFRMIDQELCFICAGLGWLRRFFEACDIHQDRHGVAHIAARVYRLIDQILPLLADNALDVATLKELLGRDAAGGWGVEKICLIGLVICWLVAIGHAYFVGKKIDSASL